MDGGFVRKRLAARKQAVDAGRVLEIAERISGHRELRGSQLLRTHFYDAPPLTERLLRPLDRHPIELGGTPQFHSIHRLHNELRAAKRIALRLGELQLRGWIIGPAAQRALRRHARALQPDDFIPDVVQKGVDLRIGLDIARLAFQRLVDSIVLVTGDSDFLPAMKLARREGLRIFLDTLGQGARLPLLEHSDYWFGSEPGTSTP